MAGRRTDLDHDPFAEFPEHIGGDGGAHLVGQDAEGALYYYDEEDRVVATALAEATPDPDFSEGRVLAPEESIADLVEDVAAETGWTALTEYAERLRTDEE